MRKQTNEDLSIIREQKDMLNGNINRMCVTDSLQELVEQKNFAEFRIGRIFAVNYNRLTESEDVKNAETE